MIHVLHNDSNLKVNTTVLPSRTWMDVNAVHDWSELFAPLGRCRGCRFLGSALPAAHTLPFGEAIPTCCCEEYIRMGFKLSTHVTGEIRKMNTCIGGAKKALFNKALPHQLTFGFHGAYYSSSRKVCIWGLVGRGQNRVLTMQSAKLIRSGDS